MLRDVGYCYIHIPSISAVARGLDAIQVQVLSRKKNVQDLVFPGSRSIECLEGNRVHLQNRCKPAHGRASR